MKMKKSSNCGFSRLWHLASFVRPQSAERAGAPLNCIRRKGRSNGEDHPPESLAEGASPLQVYLSLVPGGMKS